MKKRNIESEQIDQPIEVIDHEKSEINPKLSDQIKKVKLSALDTNFGSLSYAFDEAERAKDDQIDETDYDLMAREYKSA